MDCQHRQEVTDVDNREEKLSHKLSPLDLCVLSSSGDNTALQTQSEILKKTKNKTGIMTVKYMYNIMYIT